MIKQKAKIEKDMKSLVKHVTGFDESDENFQLCISFTDSNFKYHRYMSPDSHKIHRAIEGVCEKFEVHSQKKKAIDLRELTTLFLEQTGLDGKDYGKTDVHYALLSLILNLAESPTKRDFHRKEEEIVDDKVDDFDWKKYLIDDADLNLISYASSDSEEDEESLPDTYESDSNEDDDDDNQKKFQRVMMVESEEIPPHGKHDNSQEHNNLTFQSQCDDDVSKVIRQRLTDDSDKLARVLTVEYWKGKCREEETVGSHVASNLARDWNFYQSHVNEFHTSRAQTVVTEHQIIRETLWMLSGITELFIFKFDGKDFRLNPDIFVMHLTTESLENSLRPLMRKAAQVCALQTFVNDIVSQVCSIDGSRVPQTYQAFASCVAKFLSDFRIELQDREKFVMNQEDVQTLARLTSELQPWLAKVQAVHGVYISGIASVSNLSDQTGNHCVNNCFKASLLLNVLYQAVTEADLTSLCDEKNQSSFLLHMLLKSSEPVIQITSDWINNGQLRDPAEEFIVQRNKKIPLLNETFWDQAFVANIQTMLTAAIFDVTLQKPTNQEAPNNSYPTKSTNQQSFTNKISGQSHRVQLSHDQEDLFLKHGPTFLQPVLEDAVLTGKSMEMLENLGMIGEVLDVGYGVYERPPSLYELFVRDLKNELGTEDSISNSETDFPTNTYCNDSIIEKLLYVRGERDTLLGINFSALFPDGRTQTVDKQKKEELPVFTNNDLSPLMRLCESCLYPHIRSRYRIVCTKLVNILKSDYHLMESIHAMQRYYLMSSGEVMSDFYTPVFQKIMNREFWHNTSLLELYLHEAVASRYPDDLSKLTVSVSPASSHKDRTPINLTDCIQMKYKVPWPVDMIISDRCQQLYNNIFTFLLQIKRAKYSVDQLRFEDLSSQQVSHQQRSSLLQEHDDDDGGDTLSCETRVHRCHLLRFRLLYFVNCLHSYIMTRILHSTGLEYISLLEDATDLEQVIRVHRQYVEAIHERCLLHPRLAVLKDAVVRVLNLSLTFSMLWRQGLKFVSGDCIEEMETELSSCIHFLSAFLNNLTKRGSLPHLESLAFALISLQHASS